VEYEDDGHAPGDEEQQCEQELDTAGNSDMQSIV
jgi:hypothetical protein